MRFLRYGVTAPFLFFPFALFFIGILVGIILLLQGHKILFNIFGGNVTFNQDDLKILFVKSGWVFSISMAIVGLIRKKTIMAPSVRIGVLISIPSFIGHMLILGTPIDMSLTLILFVLHILSIASIAVYVKIDKVFQKVEEQVANKKQRPGAIIQK